MKNPTPWITKEDIADAQLMAAAQDMLDALMQWRNAERHDDIEELQNARNSRDLAIAKARGGRS